MFLWEPSASDKPVARMTGHLQLINQARMLAGKPSDEGCHRPCFPNRECVWGGGAYVFFRP